MTMTAAAPTKPKGRRGTGLLSTLSVALLALLGGAGPAPSAAAVPTRDLFVSPAAKASAAGSSCKTARFATIMAAIGAAKPGSTIIVCPGTYHGQVTVIKPLVLEGEHATIDATGSDNGVTVPSSGTTVEGFTVTGAIGEGILVVGKPGVPVTHVTIKDNVVTGNDRGNFLQKLTTKSSYRECNELDNVPGDCGEAVHLMVAASSVVEGNTVEGNGGGILLSDEFGPVDHNLVEANTVEHNHDGGIIVVSHAGLGFVKGRLRPTAGGDYANTIEANVVEDNPGAIVLATPVPGGAVYNNVVKGNIVSGNGDSGVTVHSHVPGQYMNGNVVEGNTIKLNNLDGDPDFKPVDHATTGVLVGTIGPLSITIAHNTIIGDTYGIWYLHPATVTGVATNTFRGVRVRVHAA
ncbi:MAG: right-handed parallel beta-helix repeat-containing protein [Acidimicrobiales bacterium]